MAEVVVEAGFREAAALAWKGEAMLLVEVEQAAAQRALRQLPQA